MLHCKGRGPPWRCRRCPRCAPRWRAAGELKVSRTPPMPAIPPHSFKIPCLPLAHTRTMSLQLSARASLAARPTARLATRSTRRALRVRAEAPETPAEAAPAVESAATEEVAPPTPTPAPAAAAGLAFAGEGSQGRPAMRLAQFGRL